MGLVDKKDHIAKRMQNISPFYVMDILARAKHLESQGYDVIHLEVGEPDFTTPQSVKAAAIQAIDDDHTYYTSATGLPELKRVISSYYKQRLSADIASQNIVITPGASGALQLALSVVVDPGKNVLMADPGYPCNRHFVRLLESCAKTIPVGAESHYQLTHNLIDEAWDENTTCALIASPSNPTGTLISRDEMLKIIEVVKRHDGILIVDEIYQGLVYDQPDYSAAELDASCFVINSFSKYFSMTGWRLGWLVVPELYLNAVERLAQNLFLAPPTISQYAAIQAFEKETLTLLDKRKDELKYRRDFLLGGLKELGFGISVQPGGAFYIYASVAKYTQDSFDFCRQLLEQAHVAITPGIDFGDYQANLYVRFAYTQNIEILQQALERMRKFLTSGQYKTDIL